MFKRKITIKVTGLLMILLSHSFAVMSQQMGEAERKSMEKGKIYPNLKGVGQGVSGPGSNLPPEKMRGKIRNLECSYIGAYMRSRPQVNGPCLTKIYRLKNMPN